MAAAVAAGRGANVTLVEASSALAAGRARRPRACASGDGRALPRRLVAPTADSRRGDLPGHRVPRRLIARGRGRSRDRGHGGARPPADLVCAGGPCDRRRLGRHPCARERHRPGARGRLGRRLDRPRRRRDAGGGGRLRCGWQWRRHSSARPCISTSACSISRASSGSASRSCTTASSSRRATAPRCARSGRTPRRLCRPACARS